MGTLFIIIVSIAYPALLYFCFTDNPQTSKKLNIRLIRTVYIVNAISLLYVLFGCICCFIIKLQSEINQVFLVVLVVVLFPLMLILLLRVLFLPYTHSLLWTILYIIYLKKNRFPKKETLLFIVLLGLSVLGLVGMELTYQDFMGHIGSV